MWPYTDDEAGWLTPPKRAERPVRASVNDNDPQRRAPLRPRPVLQAPVPPAERKPDIEP